MGPGGRDGLGHHVILRSCTTDVILNIGTITQSPQARARTRARAHAHACTVRGASIRSARSLQGASRPLRTAPSPQRRGSDRCPLLARVRVAPAAARLTRPGRKAAVRLHLRGNCRPCHWRVPAGLLAPSPPPPSPAPRPPAHPRLQRGASCRDVLRVPCGGSTVAKRNRARSRAREREGSLAA